MRNGDEIDFNADVQRHDTKPNRFVRVFQFGTATQIGWSSGGLRRYWRFSEHASATRRTVVRVTAGITRHVGSRRDVRATLHSSFIERSTLSTRFRLHDAFTPNFTAKGYAERFAASGRLFDYGELSTARSAEQRVYGAASDRCGRSAGCNANGRRQRTGGEG